MTFKQTIVILNIRERHICVSPGGEILKIGDVYLMKFDGEHSEQNGWRPGIIIQNNVGNAYSPNVIAVPLTSSIKKLNDKLSTHVVIPVSAGLKKTSVALCENPVTISKSKCSNFIVHLDDIYMRKIASACIVATGIISFVSLSEIEALRKRCVSLNTFDGR